jgi:hypothetical protein
MGALFIECAKIAIQHGAVPPLGLGICLASPLDLRNEKQRQI